MSEKHLLDFVINLPGNIPSRERTGPATNSEIRRWFNRGSVVVNGNKANWNDPVPEVWESLVLHPAGKSKTTLW